MAPTKSDILSIFETKMYSYLPTISSIYYKLLFYHRIFYLDT